MAARSVPAAPVGSNTSAAAASMAAAAAFYSVATERSIELPTQAYSSGAALVFNLPPTGIGTYAIISFKGTLSVTSGVTASQPSASPWYPYNLLGVYYADYLNFIRVSVNSCWQLHMLEMVKQFQFDPSNPAGVSPAASISSATMQYLFEGTVPTATASATTTAPIAFSVVMPISTSRNSIRGSHLFNITGAQDQLTINCIAPTGGANAVDSPLTVPAPADTSVAVTGSIDVSYYYLDWPAGAVVPETELSLAHQINSVSQNQNISAGQQYQYLIPTGFIYSRFVTEFINNGAVDTTDVTQFSFYMDANTPVHTENLISYLARSLRLYGKALPTGEFVTDLSSKPVNSNSYSQVAINLVIGSGATVASPIMRTTADGLTLQNQNLTNLGAQA